MQIRNNTSTFLKFRFSHSFLVILLAAGLFNPAKVLSEADTSGGEVESTERVSLADLAAAADVVAVVQMKDGDYRYQRDFPVSGSAYLKVLIPYKVDQPLDLIDVFEKGLHENECYFPNPTVFEEGRRYLVFLARDPEDPERYRGLPQGCALDVLVTENNRYALRVPVTGIELSDGLLELAEPMQFSDPYAIETDETIDSVKRDLWLDSGWLARDGENLVYTLGISLENVRRLMGPSGVSMDRHQKRVQQP